MVRVSRKEKQYEETREVGMCLQWMGSGEESSTVSAKGTLEPIGNDVENYVGAELWRGLNTRLGIFYRLVGPQGLISPSNDI